MPIRDYPFRRYSFYDRKDVAAVLTPSYPFQPQRGSWGISGIVRFTKNADYVFFVSFGQTQAGHEFDEAVYSNGIVHWQSQPAQKLATPMIQGLIRDDYLRNDILLFLRTKTDGPYMFMGFLKYLNHEADREQPVHFHWQILEFDSALAHESMLSLKLEPAPNHSAQVDSPSLLPLQQTLVAAEAPGRGSNAVGVSISTKDFHRPPIDYEDRDRRNRKLGRGEKLSVRACLWRIVTQGRFCPVMALRK